MHCTSTRLSCHQATFCITLRDEATQEAIAGWKAEGMKSAEWVTLQRYMDVTERVAAEKKPASAKKQANNALKELLEVRSKRQNRCSTLYETECSKATATSASHVLQSSVICC